jgi:hypothetical protein
MQGGNISLKTQRTPTKHIKGSTNDQQQNITRKNQWAPRVKEVFGRRCQQTPIERDKEVQMNTNKVEQRGLDKHQQNEPKKNQGTTTEHS